MEYTARARSRPTPTQAPVARARSRPTPETKTEPVQPVAKKKGPLGLTGRYLEQFEDAKVYAEEHGLPAPVGGVADYGEPMFGGPARPPNLREYTIWPSGYNIHAGFDIDPKNPRLGRLCHVGSGHVLYRDVNGKLVYHGEVSNHLEALALLDLPTRKGKPRGSRLQTTTTE